MVVSGGSGGVVCGRVEREEVGADQMWKMMKGG